MVLLYNIRGRGLPPPISLLGVIYLSLPFAFLVDENSFEELLPFFTRSENYSAPSASTPALFAVTSAQKQALAEVHGSGGPVQITYNNFLTDLDVPPAHAVVAAAGLAPNANPDDGTD